MKRPNQSQPVIREASVASATTDRGGLTPTGCGQCPTLTGFARQLCYQTC